MIGFFDSGVGGLQVWREFTNLQPNIPTIYLADQAFFPYGNKSAHEITARSTKALKFFKANDVHLAIVACNTATAAAINILRKEFKFHIVGTQPPIKLATQHTKSAKVTIWTTAHTADSQAIFALIARQPKHIQFNVKPMPKLVKIIELGKTHNRSTDQYLHAKLQSLIDGGHDVLGLGCTHFSFLTTKLKNLSQHQLTIVDVSKPVALRAESLLKKTTISSKKRQVKHQFFTTGNPDKFSRSLKDLLNITSQVKLTNI